MSKTAKDPFKSLSLRSELDSEEALQQQYKDPTYITGMVDEPGSISPHGGINHHVIVHLEHVAANPLLVIVPLPVVSQYGPDLLPCVLYHLQ